MFIPQGWRFDLVGISESQHWPVMRDLVQLADQDPTWESAWVFDHFHTTPVPSDTEATHEAWSLMAGFAAVTERVRLGQMCTCMGYRNPAYLAKVAATCDHISGGRIEMGIGGGWYEHEWRAYGYGFPEVPDRLRMLREGVEIFRQAWTTGKATLDGKHYQVDGAIVQPKPLQEAPSGIPLWIAGGGEQVTLRIAARYADYTNFFGMPDGFARKSDILAAHCKDVGTDFDRIVRSSNFNALIAPTEAEVEQKLREYESRLAPHLPTEQLENAVNGLRKSPCFGTPEQISERLREYQQVGLAYTICNFPDAAYDTSGIELFAKEVAPNLQ